MGDVPGELKQEGFPMNPALSTPTLTLYLRNQIMSATPIQLIVLLYDGLARFLTAAHDGFGRSDPQDRHEIVSNNLLRSQSIVTELNACLDMERGGEVARQLRDIYTFLNNELAQVNVRKDPSMVLRLIGIVNELRDAWGQVSSQPVGVPALVPTTVRA